MTLRKTRRGHRLSPKQRHRRHPTTPRTRSMSDMGCIDHDSLCYHLSSCRRGVSKCNTTKGAAHAYATQACC